MLNGHLLRISHSISVFSPLQMTRLRSAFPFKLLLLLVSLLVANLVMMLTVTICDMLLHHQCVDWIGCDVVSMVMSADSNFNTRFRSSFFLFLFLFCLQTSTSRARASEREHTIVIISTTTIVMKMYAPAACAAILIYAVRSLARCYNSCLVFALALSRVSRPTQVSTCLYKCHLRYC